MKYDLGYVMLNWYYEKECLRLAFYRNLILSKFITSFYILHIVGKCFLSVNKFAIDWGDNCTWNQFLDSSINGHHSNCVLSMYVHYHD